MLNTRITDLFVLQISMNDPTCYFAIHSEECNANVALKQISNICEPEKSGLYNGNKNTLSQYT